MKDIENEVLTPGKKTKTRSSRGKSFGYQILGFGSGAAGGPFIEATGGTITTVCTNYKVHTFTGPGSFVVTAGTCVTNNDVAYVVVGGGGAGGRGIGAGGGAGGFREGKNNCVTPYTASPIAATSGITVTSQSYPITVGAGTPSGCSPGDAPNLNGNVSTFSTITSAGGGGGGTSQTYATGGSGGSGGGGTYTWAGVHVSIPAPTSFRGAGDTPDVTPNQGFPGGKGWDAWYNGVLTGAGGGASAQGGDSSASSASAGAAGVSSSITGSSVAYAGGGGGAAYGIHLGPFPGGGNSGGASPCGTGGAGGGNIPNKNASTNKGGGGGGGNPVPGPEPEGNVGGSGGSGVVIIRYKFQ